jgi:phage FluMu gp28-like protein
MTLAGASCIEFRRQAFQPWAAALRSAAAVRVSEVKYSCRSPALSASNPSLRVAFTVDVVRVEDVAVARANLRQAAASGVLGDSVAAKLQGRFVQTA